MKLSESQATRIDELIEVGRDIVRRELTKASAGNLSFRDPEDSSFFFVTATGTWLDTLTPDSFVRVPLDGKLKVASVLPSSEWRLHARVYNLRPDSNVVLHAHPKFSVLMVALAKEIRLFTLDHVSYVGPIGISPFFPNGSDSLANSAAEKLIDHDCVIMEHHGCAVTDQTVLKAYRRLLNLEDAAESSYLALAINDSHSRFPEGQQLSVHS